MEKETRKEPFKKFGLFIKINFINSFNKFKNDKELENRIKQEIPGE